VEVVTQDQEQITSQLQCLLMPAVAVVAQEVLVVRKVAVTTVGLFLTKLVKVESEFFLILPVHQLAMVVVALVMQVAVLVQQLVAGLVVLRH
jgi:hypothetical protein